MEVALGAMTVVAGLGGIALGGLLARRNEKKSQGERLLVEALNDAATAIAEVASGAGRDAQSRYASAVSRIALHASPSVITKFRLFQEDATTSTADGRARLIAAIQQARSELDHQPVADGDIAVLLFGSERPAEIFCPTCGTILEPGEPFCANCRTRPSRSKPGLSQSAVSR